MEHGDEIFMAERGGMVWNSSHLYLFIFNLVSLN